MMMPRKKRRAIFISVILSILLIVAIIILILYSTTDMFKSDKVLFEKYAKQLLDNVEIIFNEEHMAEIEEFVNNNKLTSRTNATINYTENGDTSNPINNIQMTIVGEEEKTAGYHYKDIALTQNEETLLGAEYIEDGNIAGVRLNGIRQYVSTNINGENENEIYSIYKLVHTDIKELLGITLEEWNTLKNKYMTIIMQNIINANYSKQTGIVLEIDGKQYTTNAYTLILTKEQFNNIYIQILEELVQEEIILSKIEAIDNQINEYHSLRQDGETSNFREQFIDKINNTIQKIQNFNIGNNERTISVFESNGVAISFSVDTEEDFVGLDVINSEEKNFINLLGNEKVDESQPENSFDVKLEKTASTNNETINVAYNIVEEGKETKNEFSMSKQLENTNIYNNIYFNRSVGKNSLEFTVETNTSIINEFEEKEELVENENNIIIENITEEQRQIARNSMGQNLSNQINHFLQIVPLESINQMFINVGIMEEQIDEIASEESVTEVERNRFNATFELYEREHIDKERIKELIDITKENLEDVRITNFRQQGEERIPLEYRLVIERGADNSELAESVITYIEENYNGEFSVRLEYDEKTGLVNNIYIAVMEN